MSKADRGSLKGFNTSDNDTEAEYGLNGGRNPDGGGEKFSVRAAAAVAFGSDGSRGERRWVCAEHFLSPNPSTRASLGEKRTDIRSHRCEKRYKQPVRGFQQCMKSST